MKWTSVSLVLVVASWIISGVRLGFFLRLLDSLLSLSITSNYDYKSFVKKSSSKRNVISKHELVFFHRIFFFVFLMNEETMESLTFKIRNWETDFISRKKNKATKNFKTNNDALS